VRGELSCRARFLARHCPWRNARLSASQQTCRIGRLELQWCVKKQAGQYWRPLLSLLGHDGRILPRPILEEPCSETLHSMLDSGRLSSDSENDSCVHSLGPASSHISAVMFSPYSSYRVHRTVPPPGGNSGIVRSSRTGERQTLSPQQLQSELNLPGTG